MPVHASGLQASDCIHLRNRLSLGWPSFEQVRDRLENKGPLPLHCSCGYEHYPLIGLSEDDTFRTSVAVGFGPDFWNSCVYDASLERRFVSLRAGDQADALLHSSLRRLLRVLRLCAPSMRHGKLAHLLVLCWWTLLPLTTYLPVWRVPLISLLLAQA